MGVKVRKPRGYRAWCVVVDYKGQRKTIAIGSREAAERVRREIEVRLAVGGDELLEHRPPSQHTLAEYSKNWLAHVADERKPSTAGFYGQFLRLYVLPKFGQSTLDSIEREDVKEFISELGERGFAKNTIRLAVTTLRATLNGAVEDGLIDHNPAQRLGRFVKSEKPAREATSLKPNEVERLLAAAKNELELAEYALILTALRAGLREGEIAALEWGDIHFGDCDEGPDRYILVRRNYDRRWSRKMLTTKGKKPRRVDMSRELRRILLQLRDRKLVDAAGKADVSNELVFPSQAGTPIEMNNFSERVFKPLVSRTGLRKIRFHDLRHTYGSLLIQAGASLAYIREQMGHSSIQVTVDIYGHLIPGANVGFVDKLDAMTCPQESARQPQETKSEESDEFKQILGNEWLGGGDSNPDTQNQSLST